MVERADLKKSGRFEKLKKSKKNFCPRFQPNLGGAPIGPSTLTMQNFIKIVQGVPGKGGVNFTNKGAIKQVLELSYWVKFSSGHGWLGPLKMTVWPFGTQCHPMGSH